ncbi:unnamed protein product [Symbiodinium microadriaticum]|nr:unnamed protein product [Symbiodinium microadriaticum]
MDVAGTDPPTTPDSPDLDLSPSGPSGPVPDETLLEDLLPRPGGDASSSAVAPDPKRPRLRSVTIRSLQGSEELLRCILMKSFLLQAYEDELTELLHESDEVELTADGIPKCLIRDLSDHEPVLDAEELAEVDRHACLYEVKRLTGLSVLCEVPGPLPGHRTLSTKFVVTWRQKVISGRECWLRRARLVAREFAFLDPHREGLFSPASSAIALKIIPGWSLMTVDVADAYLTCDQGEPTITSVRLPPRQLQHRANATDAKQPSVLKFPQQQGGALLHVDDMLAAGVKSVLEDCCSQLRKKYKISVQWVNEVNDELTFLKKRHLLISDGELCIHVQGKHLDRLLELTCLDKAKLRSRQAPMPTGALPTESENDPLLSDAEASSAFTINSQLVYSASRSQRLIALSSAEAEYHAAISCSIDGILIRSMVEYLFPNPTAPLRILVDNQAARSMMQRQGAGKIRHIHARLLWIQQRVQLGEIVVGPVPTAVNIADLMTKSLSPSRIKFLLHMMNIRDSENGYEAVGAEEAAAQSRMIKICRVHKQVKSVVSHADENMICMLQAFLVAMQAARTLGADEPNEGNDDEDLNGASSYSQQVLTMIFQVFAYAAAFAESYPSFLSAALQVVVICMVLFLASCLFRRDMQPTVNVTVSVDSNRDCPGGMAFDKPLGPTPGGGAPGTPQQPMQCTTSGEESSHDSSFDPDQWITDAAKEARVRRKAEHFGAASKVRSSPKTYAGDDDRSGMPGSSSDQGQLPKPPGARRREVLNEVWVASRQGRRYHRIGCGKLHAASEVVALTRAEAIQQGYTACGVCKS